MAFVERATLSRSSSDGNEDRELVGADALVQSPRFNWLVSDKIPGAPHPDRQDGFFAVALFLRAHGIRGVITVCERPLAPSSAELGFLYLFVETPDFRRPADLPQILAFVAAQTGISPCAPIFS